MNDRALSLLENYDLTVLRSRKGRGAIILETETGLYRFMEYRRRVEKLPMLEQITRQIDAAGICLVDHYLPGKEGQWYVKDRSDVTYIVKEYHEGRECDIHDNRELLTGASVLAKLHRVMKLPAEPGTGEEFITNSQTGTNRSNPLADEFARHNRELRRALQYLKRKSQRTEFELFLLKIYMPYMARAEDVLHMCEKEDFTEMYRKAMAEGQFIHGEYQYHNLLFAEGEPIVANFENAIREVRIRDLYYYLRKSMEKNNWDEAVGIGILEEYEKIYPLEECERRNLYLRLLYPDKFRKIINCYYNGPKSLFAGKLEEKMRVVLEQERAKESFMNKHLFFM